MANYCFDDANGVMKTLKTARCGLSENEAAARLAKYGANELEKKKKNGIVKLFFSQFGDIMTLLLIAAAALSGLIAYLSKDTGELKDTVIILAIILMNAVVGTVQSARADRAIENLKKLSASNCKVRRGDKVFSIPCAAVTVGDIVLLEEGDVVPADCRLISSNNLACNESALTGESGAVEKNCERIRGNRVALGDMKNMLFGSTFVVRGNGEAAVTGVGMDTEMGKIAAMLQKSGRTPTPLEKSLNKLGKFISVFVLAVTAVIFVMGLVVKHEGILKNFMTSVAIAVAAIPEGLPAVVTILMAMGVQKMAKKGVVIRKLKSVETLGSCNVICSDKTGTLTRNELRVEQIHFDGETRYFKDTTGGIDKLCACMAVCNGVKGERGAYIGDPTEIALKNCADELGYTAESERVAELPFTSERKMMSVTAKVSGERLQFTKGAPDVLIKRCTRILEGGEVRKLTDGDRQKILAENDSLSDDALRVLALAYKPARGEPTEDNLIFLGLCGMRDGLKDGVKEAVEECRRAGISTVMITGDHVKTAFAIAKSLSITDDPAEVMTGEELDALPKGSRDQSIARCKVFARVQPKHKLTIVKSLQRRKNVVAMTGDGINDAPAIESADIGIAMGLAGTDVTKSASDMVICDDNFTTIVSAVREGRRISANIRKTIMFFLSTNLAEVLAILFASLVLFRFDFLQSTQLLWLNLITDSFPVLALGVEKGDADIMTRPPESAEKSLFSKSSLAAIAVFGAYITVATVLVFTLSVKAYGNEVATTMTFMALSFLELFQAFNVRSDRQSAFSKGAFSNRALVATVLVGVAVNVLLCVTPLSGIFSLSKLSLGQWATVFAVSLSILPFGEAYKLALRTVLKIKRGKVIKPRKLKKARGI